MPPFNHLRCTGRRQGATFARVAVAGMWAAILVGLVVHAPDVQAATVEPTFSEYKVKAAFIFNFAKYVEWPAAAFDDLSSPIVIGVNAESPLFGELESLVRDRRIGGRNLVVRACNGLAAAKSVHILFVNTSDELRLSSALLELESHAILTVGESARFTENGGVIGFVEESEKLHFKINLREAQRAHLKVSSQLLKLAISVERQDAP